MSAAWVAGSVRARSMTRRRLGRAGARSLASAPTLEAALAALVRTPYGHDVRLGQTLSEAQRATYDALVWNARVLGGWVPRSGASLLRVLLAPFEIANVADHLGRLRGEETPPPFRLGSLGTTWPRLAGTSDAGQLRRVLATSAWGDPGGDSADDIVWSMRMSLADRLTAVVPVAAPWASGAVALLLARLAGLEDSRLPAGARLPAARVVGPGPVLASSLQEVLSALPRHAAWAVEGVQGPEDLWRAECRWWARVERDGFQLARSAGPRSSVLLGALALMASDAWRVRAALEIAARPDAPVEAFDAVA